MAHTVDDAHIEAWARRGQRLAPMKDIVHLAMRGVLATLPADARILCVGVGTGPELLYLADAFPQWSFVGVDPAPAMIATCQRRVEAAGLTDRVVLHEGMLDTLPPSPGFDAATSLLVSQFLLDRPARRAFFAAIRDRLKPDGVLVTADLAAPDGAFTEGLSEAWFHLMAWSGMTDDEAARYRENLGTGVAVWPPAEIEALIASAGFSPPTRLTQAMLIHTWFARRQDPHAERPVRRGDLYWLLDPHGPADAVPHPHLVVQDDALNGSRLDRVVVCALTSNPRRANEPGNVLLEEGEGGLTRSSTVVVSQIASVARHRLGAHIGRLPDRRVDEVLAGLRFQQASER